MYTSNSKILIYIFLFFVVFGCKLSEKTTKSNEEKELIPIHQLKLSEYNSVNTEILKRYLIGNARWDYIEKRGKTFAIRREIQASNYIPYEFDYISKHSYKNNRIESRIIISFGEPLGLRNSVEKTLIQFSNKSFDLRKIHIQKQHGKYESRLIIHSDNLNIQIFESSYKSERIYTKKVLEELILELNTILLHKNEIEKFGKLSFPIFYPISFDSTFFIIDPSA
ncbi:MAG: hypothetical protein JEZ09_20345, partial [Salinivirgaceae bacterium]|nr:hypothetical protein [Salinivirgaceae bacterium]